MVVMINFHASRSTVGIPQTTDVYRQLVAEIFYPHNDQLPKSQTQEEVLERKIQLDCKFMNEVACADSEFQAYLACVKFQADQCFDQCFDQTIAGDALPSHAASFERKFHALSSRFGMDVLATEAGLKWPYVKLAATYCFNAFSLASSFSNVH